MCEPNKFLCFSWSVSPDEHHLVGQLRVAAFQGASASRSGKSSLHYSCEATIFATSYCALVCGMLLNCLLSVACFCLWLVWMKLLDKSYHTKQFFSHINYIFDQILCFCCVLQFDIFKIPKLLTYLQFVGRWSAGARQQKWAYKLDWIGFFLPLY